MGSYGVVVAAPLPDHDLHLLQAVEDFSVQAFVSQFVVEALVVTVFPRTAGFDEQGFGTNPVEPFPDERRSHLWPVVRSDMLRHTMSEHTV